MSIPSLVAAVSLAVSPAHVALVFAPENRLLPAVERHALAEAAAIWAPYGVVVTANHEGCASEHADLNLSVVMSRAPAASETALQMPLGAVDFDAAGAPAHIVIVFLDRLVRLLEEASLWQLPAVNWPRGWRERIVGRAIGRVLAHEIGHVLLRSKGHADRGLMRAVQRADELVHPARNRYRLN
jgi:hypothetical protein